MRGRVRGEVGRGSHARGLVVTERETVSITVVKILV
jgi:hypothetical protein